MLSHLGELKKYLKKSFIFGKKHAMLNIQLQVIFLISKWQVFVRANINCFKELWQNCYFQRTAPNVYVIAWGTFRNRTTA